MEAGLLSMEPACEGHPQIGGVSTGVRVVLNRPEVLDRPVLEGASAVDGLGVAIYGSVICDGGVFRMWYQAWPKQALKGGDSVLVACAESDDGLVWRRPSYNLMEWEGRRDNHLTDLPFHSPSVLIDPAAAPEARYRAFGCTGRRKLADLGQDFQLAATAHYAYYSAHSADGLHWIVDGPEPAWPWADVITSTWDPWAGNALVALKHNGHSAGMHRRRFRIANWSNGIPSEAVTALIPDEYDDQIARSRGFESADYYGLGLYPGPTVTIGFLWNFRHQAPLSSNISLGHFGGIGSVDVSLVYQTERGGSWQHLPGRPDWMAACDKMEEYNKGSIPAVIRNHEKVAGHYKLPSVNLALEVTERINRKEFSWEKDFEDLHPSPFGHKIYSSTIARCFDAAWIGKPNRQKPKPYRLPPKLNNFCYNSGELLSPEKVEAPKGFNFIPDWNNTVGGGTRPGFVNVPMLVGTQTGDRFELNFEGTAIGIFVAAGPDAGMVEFKIDDGPWKKQDLYTKWSGELHIPWLYVLEAELKPNNKHKLTVHISKESNEKSKGHACRIVHIAINGNEHFK